MFKTHNLRKIWNDTEVDLFKKVGVKIKSGDPSWVKLGNAEYNLIKDDLSMKGCTYSCRAEFTKAEVTNAPFQMWLGISEKGGYPQPDKEFGYMQKTFDKLSYCEKCKIGKIQKTPYWIKSEPKISKLQYFGIQWEFDALFVTKDWYDNFWKNYDLDAWPVSIGKQKKKSDKFVQLKIPITKQSLQTNSLKSDTCMVCGYRKVIPKLPCDFYYSDYHNQQQKIFLTKEEFGSGGSSNRRIVLSNEIVQELLGQKQIKLSQLHPILTNAKPSN